MFASLRVLLVKSHPLFDKHNGSKVASQLQANTQALALLMSKGEVTVADTAHMLLLPQA